MGLFENVPGIDKQHTTRRNATVTALYLFAGVAAIDVLGTEGADETVEQPPPADLSAVSRQTEWLQNSVRVSGNGRTVTDTFEAARFTTFIYQHEGPGRFKIELVDPETEAINAVLVDENGPVSGAVGRGLPNGQYALTIDTDSDWGLEFGEPAAPETGRHVPPVAITGDGTNVFGKVITSGSVTVRGQHDGDSAFTVRVWDEANTGPDPDATIFDERGAFEGETNMEPSGLFYITVEADGAYRLKIE